MQITSSTLRQQYLSSEQGGWRKKWKDLLPVALVFPNRYSLGISNLGFQLVYDLVNRLPDMVCERVFLPEAGGQPVSLESGHPLRDFPVVLCSVSFEQDFINLLSMLVQSGIEPLAEERSDVMAAKSGSPLVIAGGVATFINPEPLAPFVDLFVAGEAEPVLAGLLQFLLASGFDLGRAAFLLQSAQRFSGCYVPRLYQMTYGPDGILASIAAAPGVPQTIPTLTVAEQSLAGHSTICTPEAEFSDMFLVELGRGCSRGCRFCAAGFVYRPPRLWSAETIITALAEKPEGIKRVGLLGMEMAMPRDLERVAEFLLTESCQLSFSSLRADAVGDGLLQLLKASSLKTAAIAPDGGSERLRRVINKGISEADVLWAAEALVAAGVANLKLYFMIGLPTETLADLDELVSLSLLVRDRILAIGRQKGRVSTLTLSINCFVPKAWTPFQYAPMPPVLELRNRLRYIRKALAGQAHIRIQADKPDNAFFQAVLARGDRRVGHALLALQHSGKNWRHLFRDQAVDPEQYALRERKQREVFPWEVIDHSISSEYLWHEYQKGLGEKATARCDTARCRKCGVCKDG